MSKHRNIMEFDMFLSKMWTLFSSSQPIWNRPNPPKTIPLRVGPKVSKPICRARRPFLPQGSPPPSGGRATGRESRERPERESDTGPASAGIMATAEKKRPRSSSGGGGGGGVEKRPSRKQVFIFLSSPLVDGASIDSTFVSPYP